MGFSGDRSKVIIIGSGVTGLLIAHGLKQANISFSIYDKEIEPRTRSWGMGSGWANVYLGKLLPQSVLNRIPSTYIDPTFVLGQDPEMGGKGCGSIRVFDGQTGEVHNIMGEKETTKVARKRFRALLMEDVDVQFNKDLKDIEYGSQGEGVIAHFEDGTHVAGSIIIGADGAKSSVRRLLLGDSAEPIPLPFVLNNFITSYQAEQARYLRDQCGAWTNIGKFDTTWFLMTINDVPDQADPTTWKFQILITWPGELTQEEDTSESRLRLIKEKLQDWCEWVRLAIDWLQGDTEIPKDRYAFWETKQWDDHQGRVVLVGDAAHAMPFHRGQGFQNCVRDCYDLVQVLKQVSATDATLAQAIPLFAAEVVNRGATETRGSVEATYLSHDPNWKTAKTLGLAPIKAVKV